MQFRASTLLVAALGFVLPALADQQYTNTTLFFNAEGTIDVYQTADHSNPLFSTFSGIDSMAFKFNKCGCNAIPRYFPRTVRIPFSLLSYQEFMLPPSFQKSFLLL